MYTQIQRTTKNFLTTFLCYYILLYKPTSNEKFLLSQILILCYIVIKFNKGGSKMQIRYDKILNIVSKAKIISVVELSKALNVSEVTIRKDLSHLESRGLLKREHGYATMINTDDVMNRLSFNYELKRRIAQKALEIIRDGETLMIESGSCCAILAEEIAKNRRDITIIANSAFIANFIRSKIGAHLILLGGEFQNESQVMVGPLIKITVDNFHVDKFFIGTDGFNTQGAMSGDLMRAEAVRNMSQNANQTIILTESKKFSQSGTVMLLPYEKIVSIYTDDQIKNTTIQFLEAKNIKIFTVANENKE